MALMVPQMQDKRHLVTGNSIWGNTVRIAPHEMPINMFLFQSLHMGLMETCEIHMSCLCMTKQVHFFQF